MIDAVGVYWKETETPSDSLPKVHASATKCSVLFSDEFMLRKYIYSSMSKFVLFYYEQ